MTYTTPTTALWFLPFILPIAVWVSWSDMKFMKIPNKSVLALMAVFAVVGLIALPLDVWAWRWTHFLVILAIGFVLNAIGWLGAGDAKFAAAMAPFFAFEDLRFVLALYAAASLGAFFSHRMLRTVSETTVRRQGGEERQRSGGAGDREIADDGPWTTAEERSLGGRC